MNVCIIPARGGSKRIPKKNSREFCGKPMIAYSIEAAKKTQLFDRIIVSTDSSEIAEVAKKYGAEVPFIRPAALSDDHATSDQVIIHALEWMQEQQIFPEYACCIYATAPFVQPDFIKKGLDILKTKNASSI